MMKLNNLKITKAPGPACVRLFCGSTRLILGTLLLGSTVGTASAALVGHWVADDWAGGTTNWVDRVGGNRATVAGVGNSATKTPGALAGGTSASGLVFDGVNDFFSVAASQNPVVGSTSVTIAAFFNATAGASGPDGAFWRFPGPLNAEAPGSPNDWGLTYDAAGNARGFFNNGPTPTSPVSLIGGQPHTFIMTWQDPSNFAGAMARFYVDGVFIGSPSYNRDGGNGIVNNGFVIGSDTETLARYFSGAIGELRFYNTVEDVSVLSDTMFNRVPEPTSLALLAVGLAGLGFSRRKKAK